MWGMDPFPWQAKQNLSLPKLVLLALERNYGEVPHKACRPRPDLPAVFARIVQLREKGGLVGSP